MSRLIRLSNTDFVAADHIAQVKINYSAQTVTVWLKDGTGINAELDLGNSFTRSADKLIAEINQVPEKSA